MLQASETHFRAEVQGPIHTGDGPQYNLQITDWNKLLLLLKSSAPDEYKMMHRFIDELREINRCQEKVKELKDIHNLLHVLETAINTFEKSLSVSIQYSSPLGGPVVQQIWKPVVEEAKNLDSFSKDVKYLSPPFQWLEVIQLESDLQDSLDELNDNRAISNLAKELLETCHKYLFIIDNKLKGEVDHLKNVSYYLLRSICDDPALT
jgi:hypothetical protein